MTALTGDGGCSHGNSSPRAVLPQGAESCSLALELAREGLHGCLHGSSAWQSCRSGAGGQDEGRGPPAHVVRGLGGKEFCSVPES